MPSAVFVVPGPLATLTGGSVYDRRMVDGLRQRGWSVDVRELREGFPRPSRPALEHAAHAFASIDDGATVVIDGLALGAMPDVVQPHASRLKVVALVHLPLAEEIGLEAETARSLEASERRALQLVKRVVVTGYATVDAVVHLGVRAADVAVVEPGADASPLSRGSGSTTVSLLCVATISAGKGHEGLVRALAANRAHAWALTCVGSVSRDRPAVERLTRLIAAEDLHERVTLVGGASGDRLEACYDGADLFALNTARETYGMAVADALAHGLPVVSTRTGAIPTLVGDEAGLLVEPGDEPALTEALSRVLGDAVLRERLRDGARHVRERLEHWDAAVGRMAAVLERVAADG
jgi:glycosyltransferase involved in cell wall biosynthesis